MHISCGGKDSIQKIDVMYHWHNTSSGNNNDSEMSKLNVAALAFGRKDSVENLTATNQHYRGFTTDRDKSC
jgi:hypothetical protein